MKKLLVSMLVAGVAGSAMAIDWTEAQQKRLKDATEMNCTIDFRYGIYNGNDSASLALAMGKEAGWETVLFNQVRNNVLNGAASLGTVLKAPDMERRYNVYVKILTVGEHGELEGLAKLWLDNPEDYSVYRMYTYAGRWNDWDKLLVEHSKTYLKSAIVGDARTYVSWYLDRQKKTKGGDTPICTYDVIDMKGPMSLTAYSLEGGLIGNAASNLGKELAGN